MMWKSQGKLKEKRVSLNTRIFMSQINPEIKRVNGIPDGLSHRLSNKSVVNFSEALRNAEAERLSTTLCNIHYFHHLFLCILQCGVCVHWEFFFHKRDQI